MFNHHLSDQSLITTHSRYIVCIILCDFSSKETWSSKTDALKNKKVKEIWRYRQLLTQCANKSFKRQLSC